MLVRQKSSWKKGVKKNALIVQNESRNQYHSFDILLRASNGLNLVKFSICFTELGHFYINHKALCMPNDLYRRNGAELVYEWKNEVL